MIFDSPQMIEFRERYRAVPDYEAPYIVWLDRDNRYQGEKEFLENLFSKVSANKQKDWLGRLVCEDPNQHLGAWFEMMLYGWLLEHFAVEVEPEVLGNYPDFLVEISKLKLAIEAKAFLISSEGREKRRKFDRIFSTLCGVQKPFSVSFKIKQLGERLDVSDFTNQVSDWLDTSSTHNFIYQDKAGNVLKLCATPMPNLKKVGAVFSEGFWVNSDVLKPPLSKKAKQHKELRDAGVPYVIAIFLESPTLSAEEVVEAWIGKQTVVYDMETEKVIEEKISRSGIHFLGKEIKHKSVTGTLVFRIGHDEQNKTRFLQCWYVQNPYANSPVSPDLFPAQSRFVVMEQKGNNYKMGWVR